MYPAICANFKLFHFFFREVLAEFRKITQKPIGKVVIMTHTFWQAFLLFFFKYFLLDFHILSALLRTGSGCVGWDSNSVVRGACLLGHFYFCIFPRIIIDNTNKQKFNKALRRQYLFQLGLCWLTFTRIMPTGPENLSKETMIFQYSSHDLYSAFSPWSKQRLCTVSVLLLPIHMSYTVRKPSGK